MDEELYMPPCCIDRKLPPLIERGGACSFFYSQGDWGLESLWGAASLLVRGHAVTVLVTDEVDEYALRYIATSMKREWIGGIILCTASEQTELVKSELSDWLDSVWYVGGREEAKYGNMWIRSSEMVTLIIGGPIASVRKMPKHFCAYTASLQTDNITAQRAFKPWRSILRLHATIKGENEIFDGWIR